MVGNLGHMELEGHCTVKLAYGWELSGHCGKLEICGGITGPCCTVYL